MFPLSFNIIDCYQQYHPSLTEKLNCAKYKKGSFHGSRNTIKLVTYKDKIIIPQNFQKYVVKWYHMYLLHTGMDRTESMIRQHFYWPGIREAVQKEVMVCDTWQHTKWSTKKYGKLPAELEEETPCNKLCVDLIGPYIIRRKGKIYLISKAVTMIDPVTGWFGVT